MFSLKTFVSAEVPVFCKELLVLRKKKIPVPFLSHGNVGKGVEEDTELLH